MAVVADVSLTKQNHQYESPYVFKKENSVPPAGRGIAAMVASTDKKKKNNPSQKDDRGDPLGGISGMAVAIVPEEKYIFSSLYKF